MISSAADAPQPAVSRRDDERLRQRIVEATLRLLSEGGREAASTRAICAAAGVQQPTIYRLFGDKQGLLDAVAAEGFARHVTGKVALGTTGDLVDDLRAGWDASVDFGLADPALFVLMYGDPRPGTTSPAARAAWDVLASHIHRIAQAGRLRVPEEHATQLVHATGVGVTLALIAVPEQHRDLTVARLAREAVITAVTTPAADGGDSDVVAVRAVDPASAATTLRAVLSPGHALTTQEHGLLDQWLERIATHVP